MAHLDVHVDVWRPARALEGGLDDLVLPANDHHLRKGKRQSDDQSSPGPARARYGTVRYGIEPEAQQPAIEDHAPQAAGRTKKTALKEGHEREQQTTKNLRTRRTKNDKKVKKRDKTKINKKAKNKREQTKLQKQQQKQEQHKLQEGKQEK